MIQNVFLISFILFTVLYVLVNFYTMILLKEKGKEVKLFDMDFTNYKSLKSLSEEDEKYKGLYKLLLICTFLPVLTFVAFFIYSIVAF